MLKGHCPLEYIFVVATYPPTLATGDIMALTLVPTPPVQALSPLGIIGRLRAVSLATRDWFARSTSYNLERLPHGGFYWIDD